MMVKISSTELLTPYKDHVHIITADNGRTLAGHETIAKELEADVYPGILPILTVLGSVELIRMLTLF